MFLFTHLDHDVELMIVAEVEELTKFRKCTRQFKRLIKENHRFIEHSRFSYDFKGAITGPNLDDANVFLRMVCLGVVNRSHVIYNKSFYHRGCCKSRPVHQDAWDFTYEPFQINNESFVLDWVDWEGDWVDWRGRRTYNAYFEKFEFARSLIRGIFSSEFLSNVGCKTRNPMKKFSIPLYSNPARVCDPIPPQCKGIKLRWVRDFTCTQLDLKLRDLGAKGYKSKRKAEKLALWWKLAMAQE